MAWKLESLGPSMSDIAINFYSFYVSYEPEIDLSKEWFELNYGSVKYRKVSEGQKIPLFLSKKIFF